MICAAAGGTAGKDGCNVTILFLVNSSGGLYSFRRELLEALCGQNDVIISTPEGVRLEELKALGCRIELCDCLDPRGKSPKQDLRLYRFYRRLIRQVKPDCVCTYTIKPNIYGGMACAAEGVPCLANVTGLGDALERGGPLQKLSLALYRRGLRKARRVFFQNSANLDFMRRHRVLSGAFTLLPGSGVNLERHCLEPYPLQGEAEPLRLTVVGRMIPDKGIREILAAARELKGRGVCIRLIGRAESPVLEELRAAEQDGVIQYLGFRDDPHSWYASSHAVLHASYHEGMSNVLLEAAACGRPVLATNVPGCRETFIEGVSGFGFPPRDARALLDAILRFQALPWEKKREMGLQGRRHVEASFDRRQIVDAYLNEIEAIKHE